MEPLSAPPHILRSEKPSTLPLIIKDLALQHYCEYVAKKVKRTLLQDKQNELTNRRRKATQQKPDLPRVLVTRPNIPST